MRSLSVFLAPKEKTVKERDRQAATVCASDQISSVQFKRSGSGDSGHQRPGLPLLPLLSLCPSFQPKILLLQLLSGAGRIVCLFPPQPSPSVGDHKEREIAPTLHSLNARLSVCEFSFSPFFSHWAPGTTTYTPTYTRAVFVLCVSSLVLIELPKTFQQFLLFAGFLKSLLNLTLGTRFPLISALPLQRKLNFCASILLTCSSTCSLNCNSDSLAGTTTERSQ